MGQDLDCMLGGGEAQVSVHKSFNWLLPPYEFEHCHDAKQLFISIPLCLLQIAVFMHSTIQHTVDHLSMILVVLEEELIKVPKQCQHHIVGRRCTSEFFDPGR
jgi:hypothetical protein